MTAISPLQYIHKKGLFGDHQKKNENEILHISEVKNLAIIQIFQYKKSNIILKNGKERIGEKLYAVSPLKNKNIEVEIVSSHYVDPKGERVRS